jgi:hypothetical protein
MNPTNPTVYFPGGRGGRTFPSLAIPKEGKTKNGGKKAKMQ